MDSSIRFNVSADTAQFQSGMRQVDATAKSTAAGIKQAFSGVGSLLAGGAIVGAMTGLLRKMDDISDGARRIGISAEEFQKIGNAAALVGTSVEAVNKAMIRAGVAANKAAREGGDMAEAFARANLDPAKFAAAGLEERIKMVAEAQRAANGDARQMSELFEAIGVKAAGIDFSALAQEMANVNAASSDTVEALARANDELDKAKQNATIFGANLLKGIADFGERIGSFLGGSGFKTIRELEQIEDRANAINQLTKEGVFGFDANENARLIAERMEQIREKVEGIRSTTGLINEDLATGNNLEKEKTSQLERQQQLLQQQEARRKEAIRDAQMEVDLIEAKLRGDKARVAALEEQRDFERAYEQTGSFETAANVAATKAAERAAQQGASGGGIGSSGGGVGISGGGRTAMEALQDRAKTDATALADLMRLQNETSKMRNRAADLREQGKFSSSAREELRADAREQRRASEAMRRQQMMDMFGARNLGDATRLFETDSRKAGMSPTEALRRMGINRNVGEGTRDALKRFFDHQSMPEEQRKSRERGGMGNDQGGKTDKQANLATETTLNQLLQEVINRLPQAALTQ